MFTYKIELTEQEHNAVAWMTDRGYFPAETYKAMTETEDGSGVYEIPEHAAWAISQAREEDEFALFACAAPELLAKLVALEQEII